MCLHAFLRLWILALAPVFASAWKMNLGKIIAAVTTAPIAKHGGNYNLGGDYRLD